MADKSKVIIFDDGSDASKVLEFECLQNQSIEVDKVKVKNNPKKFESYIKEIAPKDSDKQVTCYVPFTLEDFVEHNIDDQRREMAIKYPNVGIFYAYEFMANDVVQQRAVLYGIKKKDEVPKEIIEEGIAPEETTPSKTKKGEK